MEYNQRYLKEKAKEMSKTKLESMTQEEINNLGNKEKKTQKILSIIGFVIMALTLILSIVCFTLPDCVYIGIFALIVLLPFLGIMVVKIFKDRKKDIQAWALTKLEHEIMAKPFLIEENINKDIVKVTILDSYTEVTDKLHAVLNYQEIIQTRYYKFKVDYKDGHSDIVTEKEGSTRCVNLMKLVDNKVVENTEKSEDRTEELRKYKKLLDDGIITEEDFNKKKNEILNKKD